MRWPFLLLCVLAAFLGANAHAQEFKCSGTVTDTAGYPLTGATVEYWRMSGSGHGGNALVSAQKTTTETNGAFKLQIVPGAGLVLARKTGLAPAWEQWGAGRDMEQHLELAPPVAMAGVLVDEAGKSVANADVFVAKAHDVFAPDAGRPGFDFFNGEIASNCFSARTDSAGHFRIENLPTNATVVLAVDAPGKSLRQPEADSTDRGALPWRAGDEDIKLVLEPVGSIEGKIVVEGGNQPPPTASVTLQSGGSGYYGSNLREPVSSAADGTFHISDVAAGSYCVQASFGTNAVPEWVADRVAVTVEAAQTARGLQLTALRGGWLEITVLGKDDRKPLPQVRVEANREQFQSSAVSDSNGVALLRLPPGDYQTLEFYESVPARQNLVTVEAGKTNRVEIEIATPKKITGIVRRPDGQPAAGLAVKLVDGMGAAPKDGKTDASGRFELKWNPGQRQNNNNPCVLVRDVEHNLAVAQDIDEDTGPLDLKLAPALTLSGRAESEGKPISNATAVLVFWTGRSASHLDDLSRGTNEPGHFEIPALPPGRKYGLLVSGPGYGTKAMWDVNASDQPGRMELDPFVLTVANLKLAGQVLDMDDNPVAGVSVNLSGDGQPSSTARTDREGHFHFDHVCPGPLQLNANHRGTFGNISAEGGDTNVVLQLGQNNMGGARTAQHKLKGTVLDADGKPVSGAQAAVFPANGQPHWRRTATNGTFTVNWSIQPWQRQNGGALLVVRNLARNLGATEPLDEDTTNMSVTLKPAMTISGVVKNTNDSPLAGARLSLLIKTGNASEPLNDQTAVTDAQGHYEIKGVPPDVSYTVIASAKGRGQGQQDVPADSGTNHLEVSPFVLKVADRVLAGQVLDADDKPVSGVGVQLNGEGQPTDHATTDRQGRFHFQVCEGQVRLFANGQQGGFAQTTAEAGDTNVVLQFGQNNMNSFGAATHKLKGVVTDPDGLPVAGAQLAVFPEFQFNGGSRWKRTATNGAFALAWSLQPWQMQQGGAVLVIRDLAHNLGATHPLDEDTTNIEVKLKPALSITGLVQNVDETSLAGAQITVQIKTGNNYGNLNEQASTSDAQGRYEVKGLPPDGTYLVMASAKGRGQSQQPVRADPTTNRLELLPFMLRVTDHVLAGQVLDADDKPVPGASVSFNGLDQPTGNLTTDSKGRFTFKVCEGSVHLSANDQQGGFAQSSAEAGDTNVVLQFGQNNNPFPGVKTHKLGGTVTDTDGNPLNGAQVAVYPDFQFNGSQWKKAATNGAYKINWSLQPWQVQQGGSAMLVGRDVARNLAAIAELRESMTNLDLKLKPALTVTGLVQNEDNSPLAGAQVSVQIKAANMFGQLGEKMAVTDAQGRYQIKCLPMDGSFIVVASAKGHGKNRLEVQDATTNHMDLSPIFLRVADRVLAGVVLNEKEKPVAGANVSLNGEGQPDGNMSTDGKGRFHFLVCEGEINLFGNSPMGGGFAQTTAEGGDSNVVLTLGVQQQMMGRAVRQRVHRPEPQESLKGSPLPDLAIVKLDAPPPGKIVLLCLFDAGQRLSRQTMRDLNEQSTTLRQQGVALLGVQAMITGGEIFNEWKSDSPMSFPVGRVLEKSDKTKWILSMQTLPWLILTDTQHHVVAEGFSLDELDGELKKLAK